MVDSVASFVTDLLSIIIVRKVVYSFCLLVFLNLYDEKYFKFNIILIFNRLEKRIGKKFRIKRILKIQQNADSMVLDYLKYQISQKQKKTLIN